MKEIDWKDKVVREGEIDPAEQIDRLKRLADSKPPTEELEKGRIWLELPGLDEGRIQNVLDSLIRLHTGKIKKIIIFRQGPIQEA